MTHAVAQQIVDDFSGSAGYVVTLVSHGRDAASILLREGEGRTSQFLVAENFFRFAETVVARLHPIN